jgi:hypothetical protein
VFEKMRSANAMIRAYCAKHPGLTYVDVEPLMLGADGKPKPELFVGDGLHMTAAGYRSGRRSPAVPAGEPLQWVRLRQDSSGFSRTV